MFPTAPGLAAHGEVLEMLLGEAGMIFTAHARGSWEIRQEGDVRKQERPDRREASTGERLGRNKAPRILDPTGK